MAKFAQYNVFMANLERLKPFQEALAETVADIVLDQIILLIETSVPSGRIYPHPDGGKYRASAPGQPPAKRTETYLGNFSVMPARSEGDRAISGVANPTFAKEGVFLWVILEFGQRGRSVQLDLAPGLFGTVAPRPHLTPAVDMAIPLIREFLDDQSLSADAVTVTRRPAA